LASLGVLGDRAGGYWLTGVCIIARVKVDGVTGWEKVKGMHMDIDGVNEDVIGQAVGCCRV
jgi:hypothetical protein